LIKEGQLRNYSRISQRGVEEGKTKVEMPGRCGEGSVGDED